jgi:hypothetical protein
VSDLPAKIGPASMADLFKFASSVSASGFYGFDSPDKAFVAISAGMDLGLSHAQSARAWHIIKGKPTLSADAMRAVCLASPHCEYFTVVEKSATTCTVETKRLGEPTPQRVTWTLADAKQAGLASGDGWGKYPRAMLFARATSELARQVYPDLLLGIYAPEEFEEVAATTSQPTRSAVDVVDVEEVRAILAPPTKADADSPAWRAWCAGLREATGQPYDVIAEWVEASGATRPSTWTASQRAGLLRVLTDVTSPKRVALDAWLAARADAREPGEEG